MQNKKVKLQDLGLIDYQEAWDYQERLFNEIVSQKIANRDADSPLETPNYLLMCEHKHVYTLGKSGKQEHLLLTEDGLKEHEAAFYKINRGGDITYHGPGQLVVYPILDLDNFFTDIHKYMRLLEEAVIETLAHFNIKSGRVSGFTGVWLAADAGRNLGERKICAMGVKASRWVTMHGLALNVKPQLNYFDNIIACGIEDRAVTSMEKELENTPSVKEVAKVLSQKLADLFEMELL